MTATIAGYKIGFSEDIQRHIPEPCANCGACSARWFPWPGLWLCKSCFINTDSRDLEALIKRLEVAKNDKS